MNKPDKPIASTPTSYSPTKIFMDSHVTTTMTPFMLDYIKSDNWHSIRDYINTYLIRYQIDVNNKLHRSVSDGKGIGVVSNLSGKITAADEFRLFLLNLEKYIGDELEASKNKDKIKGR